MKKLIIKERLPLRTEAPLYQKAVVGIEMGEEGKQVLSVLEGFLSRQVIAEIILLYVNAPLAKSSFRKSKAAPSLKQPSVNKNRNHEEVIASCINKFGSRCTLQEATGDILDEFVRVAHREKPDLLVIGRNNLTEFHRISPTSLGKQVPVDILVIPETLTPKSGIQKILVPVDFSDSCRVAVKKALTLARANPQNLEVELIHLFSVRDNTDKKSMDTIMKALETAAFEFLQPFTPAEKASLCTLIEAYEGTDKAQALLEIIGQEADGMLVLTTTAKSALQQVLEGSLSESILGKNFDFPLLLSNSRQAREA